MSYDERTRWGQAVKTAVASWIADRCRDPSLTGKTPADIYREGFEDGLKKGEEITLDAVRESVGIKGRGL